MSYLKLKKSYYQAPSWVPPIRHTTAELLDIRGTAHPDKEALVIRDLGKSRQAITFGELKSKTEQLAAGLIKRGLKKGDCVGLLCPSSIEYAICEYALARTGAILMRFHVSVKTGEDIRYALVTSNCRWLIAHPGDGNRNYQVLQSLIPNLCQHDSSDNLSVDDLPDLEMIFMISTSSYPGTIPWTTLFNGIQDGDIDMVRDRQATLDGDDIQGCFSTSGSTGRPKIVAVPGRFTTYFFYTIMMRNGVTENDCFVTDRPMAYVGGHTGAIIGIGLTFVAVVTQTSGAKHQAGRSFFLKVLEEENATVCLVFSYMMRDFIRRVEDGTLDVSKIRLGLTGGEIIQKSLVQQCLQFIPNIVNVYGSSEAAVSLGTHILDTQEQQINHTGIGTDGELKVVNEDGVIVPVTTRGELCIRSNYLFIKYWGDEEGTTMAKDTSGWFKTGDMAVMDEDGYVTIIGRKQHVISKATIKIYPRSIERVLLQHPLVEHVVAIGVPHEILFEEICVCFVGKSETLTVADVQQYCKEMFEADEAGEGLLPDYVIRFDKFIVGSTGKTDMKQTRDEAIRRLETERESARILRE